MYGSTNTAQAEAWNGYEGNHWADNHARYDAVNSGFNEHLLSAAGIGSLDRVLDVGCGNGQVTRSAARRAQEGSVLGIDLSAPMLARARTAAAEEGIANITFEQGDAQSHPFPGEAFDTAISRFGVMFFADPVAAFTNIAHGLRPGGRLVFLALRDMGSNDLGDVLAAISSHLPSEAARTPAAGAVSLADPDRIREVLTAAGFTGAAVTPVDAEQVWGADPADAAAFLCDWAPVRRMLRDADPAAAERAREAAVEAMRPFARPRTVTLRGAAWLATAVRP